MIRLSAPAIDPDDIAAAGEVLQSGWLVQGKRVTRLEELMATRHGNSHCVAVSSGTAALHAALLALDIRPGDIVIVPAYSWPATANVVELCGARPEFIDVERDTFNMCPSTLEAALERLSASEATRQRLRAIIVVHCFGAIANMEAIMALADRHGLPVIEDAACALGSTLAGRPAGSWGVMTCFSFHPRKIVTTAEGGAVTTEDAALARRLKAIRNHGLDPDSPSPSFIMPGLNYRMSDVHAAFGVTQLSRLDELLDERRRLASAYDQWLPEAGVSRQLTSPSANPNYQTYAALLPGPPWPDIRKVISQLRGLDIETNIGTWHIPMTDYYQTRYGFDASAFPGTSEVFQRVLALPFYNGLKTEDQVRTVECLKQVLDACAAEAASGRPE